MAALLLAFAASAMAQVNIPKTRVQFNFPNGGWKYLTTQQVDKNTTVYLYSYSKKPVVSKQKDTVLPFLRIMVKTNYVGSVYDIAYSRYSQQPFESLDEYTQGMPGDQSLGYRGAYTNLQDGKDYEFRMMYFNDKTTMFEVRLETTVDTYNQMKGEFEAILKTFVIKKSQQ